MPQPFRKEQWKLFWHLLFGMLLQRGKRRLGMAFLAITVSAMLMTLLGSLRMELPHQTESLLQGAGANLIITPKQDIPPLRVGGVDFAPPVPRGTFSSTVLTHLQSHHAKVLQQATPFLIGEVRFHQTPVQVVGFEQTSVKPFRPEWNIVPFEVSPEPCFVSPALLAMEEETLVVRQPSNKETQLTITGLLREGKQANTPPTLYLPLPRAQALLEMPGALSVIEANVTGNRNALTRVAAALETAFPTLQTQTALEQVSAQTALLTKTLSLMLITATLIIGAALLCIATTFLAILLERSQEIGLMKALGGTSRSLFPIFLTETSCLSLLGGIIGWLLGTGLATWLGKHLFAMHITFHLPLLMWVVSLAWLTTLLASFIPIRLALRVEPIQTLRGGNP